MIHRIALVSCFIFISNLLFTQENWSLESCIDHAYKNNLQVKAIGYGELEAGLMHNSAKLQWLPTINGNIGNGFQFGRNIDPTTNTFENQRIGYQTYAINGSLTLYSGNRQKSTLKKSKIDIQSASASTASAKKQLRLQITQVYLEILLAQEQLISVKTQRTQIQLQLEKVQEQIRLGTLRQNAYLEFESQLLRNEQKIREVENQLAGSNLTLKQFIGINTNEKLNINPINNNENLNSQNVNLSLEEVTKETFARHPQFKLDAFQQQSAEQDIAIAKSAYLPSISLFASIKTNYSSEGKVVEGMETVQIPQKGFLNGDPIFLEVEQSFPNLSDATYSQQLEDNFNQGVGATISVPIYNQHRNRTAVELAKINLLRTRTQADENRQRIKTELLKTYQDYSTALIAEKTAHKSVELTRATYEDTKSRFDLGLSTSYELLDHQNNLLIAELELNQAHYTSLLQQELLRVYMED